jgi:hypothetical protein
MSLGLSSGDRLIAEVRNRTPEEKERIARTEAMLEKVLSKAAPEQSLQESLFSRMERVHREEQHRLNTKYSEFFHLLVDFTRISTYVGRKAIEVLILDENLPIIAVEVERGYIDIYSYHKKFNQKRYGDFIRDRKKIAQLRMTSVSDLRASEAELDAIVLKISDYVGSELIEIEDIIRRKEQELDLKLAEPKLNISDEIKDRMNSIKETLSIR